MRMTDLIAKKRDGQVLSTEEIYYMIAGYTDGSIPDYQMSAMCMAILLKGMDEQETLDLTMAMTYSGVPLRASRLTNTPPAVSETRRALCSAPWWQPAG